MNSFNEFIISTEKMKLFEMYKEVKFEIPKEDCILIDYKLFFDEQLGKYNHFCIDNILDLLDLKSITDKMVLDGAQIYVCAYSYESTDLNGLKYIYADSLWIKTQRSIREIKNLFEQKRTIEPSAIVKLSENEEFEQEKIYLFSEKNHIVNFKNMINIDSENEIKCLYWD